MRMKTEATKHEPKLTYGELKRGDKFIAFPLPGDNEGHGGYLGAHALFVKTGLTAIRVASGRVSDFPNEMDVIKVLL